MLILSVHFRVTVISSYKFFSISSYLLFSDLFSISTTCRLWHSIIIDQWFLQQRFERFKKEHIIGHWKFEDTSHIGHDSSGYTKDNYSIVGHPIQSNCFLGKSMQFDGRSMITIPVKDLARYQTDYFALSC